MLKMKKRNRKRMRRTNMVLKNSSKLSSKLPNKVANPPQSNQMMTTGEAMRLLKIKVLQVVRWNKRQRRSQLPIRSKKTTNKKTKLKKMRMKMPLRKRLMKRKREMKVRRMQKIEQI